MNKEDIQKLRELMDSNKTGEYIAAMHNALPQLLDEVDRVAEVTRERDELKISIRHGHSEWTIATMKDQLAESRVRVAELEAEGNDQMALIRGVSHNYQEANARAERLKKVLQLISVVNACDYEYNRWATDALAAESNKEGENVSK